MKYNIEIDGLQLHEAQFYNSGEDYWNWSYSISEKPENLSYEDAKKALLHWKEQLEAIDFTFKLKKDTEDMYVLISENLKTKVELSCYHTWNYTSPKISFVWRKHIYTPVTK